MFRDTALLIYLERQIPGLIVGAIAGSALALAQSTTGTVVGTVKDPNGAAVAGAMAKLLNTGTNAGRSTLSNESGSYQFSNLDVGAYQLEISAVGFEAIRFAPFDLGARETRRVDADLKISSQNTSVNVEELIAAVQTDTSNIAETKGARELVDLPVAITTRATGSTSAMSTLTAQPGVQTDTLGNISVAGTLPTQLSMSIDGISSMGPGANNGGAAISELFPSFNAIEEIRIGQTINPAEFGGVADITTISKSGTNSIHGGVFENLQNNYMNASDFFSRTTPLLKMNNFGIFMGGPVVVPKLYNGRNKTFFFGSFEALRLPKSSYVIESVPTAAMRGGDLSPYSDPITGYPNNQIPASQISPYAQRAFSLLYPLPNYGPPGAIANNYLANFSIPIKSNQGDIRLDQYVGAKNQLFARFTYKNKRAFQVPISGFNLTSPPTSSALGSNAVPEVDSALTAAWNFTISPNVINELRVGFSLSHSSSSFGLSAQQAIHGLGLTNLPQQSTPIGIPAGTDIVPSITLAGFVPIFGQSSTGDQGTKQLLDTVTWTRGSHTMKFGGDYRRLHSLFH